MYIQTHTEKYSLAGYLAIFFFLNIYLPVLCVDSLSLSFHISSSDLSIHTHTHTFTQTHTKSLAPLPTNRHTHTYTKFLVVNKEISFPFPNLLLLYYLPPITSSSLLPPLDQLFISCQTQLSWLPKQRGVSANQLKKS